MLQSTEHIKTYFRVKLGDRKLVAMAAKSFWQAWNRVWGLLALHRFPLISSGQFVPLKSHVHFGNNYLKNGVLPAGTARNLLREYMNQVDRTADRVT